MMISPFIEALCAIHLWLVRRCAPEAPASGLVIDEGMVGLEKKDRQMNLEKGYSHEGQGDKK